LKRWQGVLFTAMHPASWCYLWMLFGTISSRDEQRLQIFVASRCVCPWVAPESRQLTVLAPKCIVEVIDGRQWPRPSLALLDRRLLPQQALPLQQRRRACVGFLLDGPGGYRQTNLPQPRHGTWNPDRPWGLLPRTSGRPSTGGRRKPATWARWTHSRWRRKRGRCGATKEEHRRGMDPSHQLITVDLRRCGAGFNRRRRWHFPGGGGGWGWEP
jgi:hypothetical protein